MPTNISFATATVISSFPYDFIQTDINSGGINSTVFYKLTAPVNSIVIGAWCFSGNIGSGYRPTTYLYEGPTHIAIPPYDPINAINKPFQFSVTPGTDYYFEIRKNLDDSVSANQIRIRVEVALNGTPVAGDILINDDAPGFPLAVLSQTTDYKVVRFYNGIAAGEDGDSLTGGITAFDDFNTNQIRLYSPDFTPVGYVTYASGTAHIRACRPLNKFYVGFEVNPVTVRTVNPDATYGSTTWTLTGMNGCLGFAPSNDGSKFYITQHMAGVPIRVWNVGTSAFVTDLAPAVTGNTITDILVLTDDSIVAIFESTVAGSIGVVVVKRYNPAGTLLNTYNIGTNNRPGGTFARLAASLNDLTSFWVWMHDSNGISRFLEIQVSDGAILTTRLFSEYETGILQASETATPLSRFGDSFSCPVVIARVILPGGPVDPPIDPPVEPPVTPDKSGIYFINPNKSGTFDSYYGPAPVGGGVAGSIDLKIPDPTIKTAFIGE